MKKVKLPDSDKLEVCFDYSHEKDVTVLMISRVVGGKMNVVNIVTEERAKVLYGILTKQLEPIYEMPEDISRD